MNTRQLNANVMVLRLMGELYGPTADDVLALVLNAAVRAPSLAGAIDLEAPDAAKRAGLFADFAEGLAKHARLLQQRVRQAKEVGHASPSQ